MITSKGSASTIAILMIAVLSFIGVAAIMTSTTYLKISTNYQTGIQAFYTAEAGIEHAKKVLIDGSVNGLDDELAIGTILDNIALGDGSYTVQVTDNNDEVPPAPNDQLHDLDGAVVITSTGIAPNNSRAVIKVIGSLYKSAFRKAACGCEQLRFSATAITDSYNSAEGTYTSQAPDSNGDIGSNQDIDLGQAVIKGAVEAGGNLKGRDQSSVGGNAILGGDAGNMSGVIRGSTMQNVSAPPRPCDCTAIDVDTLTSGASIDNDNNQLDPTYLMGINFKITGSDTYILPEGTYYFSTFEITGSAQVVVGDKVNIFLVGDGPFVIGGRGVANPSDKVSYLEIYSDTYNPIYISGSGGFSGTVYAPNAYIKIDTDSYGSFLGKVVEVGENINVHFDEDLLLRKDIITFSLISWREM